MTHYWGGLEVAPGGPGHARSWALPGRHWLRGHGGLGQGLVEARACSGLSLVRDGSRMHGESLHLTYGVRH